MESLSLSQFEAEMFTAVVEPSASSDRARNAAVSTKVKPTKSLDFVICTVFKEIKD